MNMSRTIYKILGSIIGFLSVCSCFEAGAQALGGYSPYSIYGIGDVNRQGTAYNQSMGGVGIANRNNRYINVMNPAAVTARDSLSFMSDFSLYANNKIFEEKGLKTANNAFNINNFVISFPIQKQSAFMIGILPYSDTGFNFYFDYDDPNLIGNTGTVSYSASGRGSIYKVFAAAGVTFFDRLSVGAQFDYYFGNLNKSYTTIFASNAYSNVSNDNTLQTTALGGKFGLQYEQPLDKNIKLVFGATYSTNAKLKGQYEDSRLALGKISNDTLSFRRDILDQTKQVKLAHEIGVGVSIRGGNKWMAEFNYTRADWRNTGIEHISGYPATSCPFTSTVSEAYRVGFEYIPNINDIRYYFNRVAYRAGGYFKKEYYMFQGNNIYSKGITLGLTLPVYRWYNGLTLGLEFGQRGTLTNNLIRERYFNFSIGINLFDIWFQKPQYE